MREDYGTHVSCHSTAQMSWVRCAVIFRDMLVPAADAALLPLLLGSALPAQLLLAQPARWELVAISCSWGASVRLLGACRLNLDVDTMQWDVFFPSAIKQLSLICSQPWREFPSHPGSAELIIVITGWIKGQCVPPSVPLTYCRPNHKWNSRLGRASHCLHSEREITENHTFSQKYTLLQSAQAACEDTGKVWWGKHTEAAEAIACVWKAVIRKVCNQREAALSAWFAARNDWKQSSNSEAPVELAHAFRSTNPRRCHSQSP